MTSANFTLPPRFDAFISHSKHDKTVADAVCHALEAHGLRCWIAPRDVVPGKMWSEAIIDGLDASKTFVLIFSSHANQSQNVLREVERAISKNLVVIPFRTEDVQPSRGLEFCISLPHWLDAMTPPLQQHLDRLTKTVTAVVGVQPVKGPADVGVQPVKVQANAGVQPVKAQAERTPSMSDVLAGDAGTQSTTARHVPDPSTRPKSIPEKRSPSHRPMPGRRFLDSAITQLARIRSQPWFWPALGGMAALMAVIGFIFIYHLGNTPTHDITQLNADEAKDFQYWVGGALGVPVEITNSLDMKLVLIPLGEFLMGSPDSDKHADDDEKPQHKVKLTKSFYLGQTEVTQGQWKAVMGTEPWKFKTYDKEGSDYAASYVSWDDAVSFCEKLSEKEGKTYQLPTEAEWEYACRGWTNTKWSFGDTESQLGAHAWHKKNANDIGEKYAHRVGQKKANPFGLSDMHGNVKEWCLDSYDRFEYRSRSGTTSDPYLHDGFGSWVLRGGSWDSYPEFTGSAGRSYLISPVITGNDIGFRVSSYDLPIPVAPLDADEPKAPQDELATNHGAPVEITNSIGMKLVEIPAGEFLMGSPDSDKDASEDEKKQHTVKITKAFYLGQTEVTQGQWKAVMGTEPWQGKTLAKEGTDYAATYVSWNDAVSFCGKLSEKEGKTYQLPTKAEWEYACRGGTNTKWSFGDDESQLGDHAWYDKNAPGIDENFAHRVGQKKPNPFGLSDMHGNVYEWCRDVNAASEFRVVRGGSWFSDPRKTRSAYRASCAPDNRDADVGFRVSSNDPPLAVAPLDVDEAEATQDARAKMVTDEELPPTRMRGGVLGPPIEITNSLDMKLVEIPAGEFLMGSLEPDNHFYDIEKPQHKVRITKAFYLGQTEVTQGQWKTVMGTEPWQGKDYVKEGSDYAATWVTCEDAEAFCDKLSQTEGNEYQLPTEAEWEYACRAGTKTRWSFGDTEIQLGAHAWYGKNTEDFGEMYAHRVGQKKENPWGLFDMHGNVYEWSRDVFDAEAYGSRSGTTNNPTVNKGSDFLVLRGGSWQDDPPLYTRSAARNCRYTPDSRNHVIGFRVSRTK